MMDLVGINEHKVERSQCLRLDLWKEIQCRSNAEVDMGRHAGPLEVAAGHLSMRSLQLKCDEKAIRWQRASQPDAAVAPQGPDFENPACAHSFRQDKEQL